MKTDQQGDTCTFTYNLGGQLLSRAYRTAANSPSGTVADSDTFTYDRAGRMLTALSGRYANTVTLAYDHAGRLASEALTIAGQTYSVGRTYDVRGLEATLSYPGGGVVQRTYTPRRQLQQTSYLGTAIETRTYDAAGRPATSTYANGAVTTNSYRLDNLLASRATSHAGTEQLGTYSYSWDANKNKTAETIGAQGSGFGFSVPAGGYDQEDRLTAWNRTDGARNQSWTLSAVGDWTAHSDAGVSQTRTHAAAHELTAVTTGGTTSPLGYDPKGNLLSRPAALASPALGLVWDFDNRLRGADTNGTPASQEVSFEYDALGRRVARSETGSSIVYVHAGQQVIADYARGAAAAAPSFRYVYGSYVDEPLLRHAGTGTTLPTSGTAALYYHRNQQYSIVGLSDAAGTLVERYAYTAYGELTILAPDRTARATSSFQNRYTYTGREWDPTLRLYYFRARWLEPKAGRFIGRDPLGYVDGMGLYGAYLGLDLSDPTGMSTQVIEVKPSGGPKEAKHKLGESNCGIQFAQSWSFHLPKKHRGGWLVQKVSVTCRTGRDCRDTKLIIVTTCSYPDSEAEYENCVCNLGESQEYTYYEAWRVGKNDPRPTNPEGMPATKYDDTATYPTPKENGGCAEVSQRGELRFYEDGDIPNLALDPLWQPKPGHFFGGETNCIRTTAGRLHAFGGRENAEPGFWKGKPFAEGHREFNVAYKCCCQNKKFNFAFGSAKPSSED